MNLSSSGKTHVGMKRTHNEDSLRIYRDENLFVVSDGMGGHASGEVASEMSAETIAAFYRATSLDEDITWPYKYNYAQSYQENRIRVGVQMSNQRIFQSSVYDMKLKGMGTTMVALSFYDSKLSIGHVGDSRVYRVRDSVLEQLTEDHSLLNDYMKLRPGGMTPEEIENFPHKNVIVRALGMKDSVEVDVITEDVNVGDLLLLCSDGLSGMITDQEMSDIINRATRDAGGILNVDLDELCEQLIAAANRNGGTDNITVLLVRSEPESLGQPSTKQEPNAEHKPSTKQESLEQDQQSSSADQQAPSLQTDNPFAPAWLASEKTNEDEVDTQIADENDHQAEQDAGIGFELEEKLGSKVDELGLDTIMDPMDETDSVADIDEEIQEDSDASVEVAEQVLSQVDHESTESTDPFAGAKTLVAKPPIDFELAAEASEPEANEPEASIQAESSDQPKANNTQEFSAEEATANETNQESLEATENLESESSQESATDNIQDDSELANSELANSNQTSESASELPQELSSEASSHEVQSDFPDLNRDFDTVRVLPSQKQEMDTVQVNRQEAVTVKVKSTELGLPTLAPKNDQADSNLEGLDNLQTVRVMPTLDQSKNEQEDAVDTLQTKSDVEETNTTDPLELAQDFAGPEIQETETQLSPVGKVEMMTATLSEASQEEASQEKELVDQSNDHEKTEES